MIRPVKSRGRGGRGRLLLMDSDRDRDNVDDVQDACSVQCTTFCPAQVLVHVLKAVPRD